MWKLITVLTLSICLVNITPSKLNAESFKISDVYGPFSEDSYLEMVEGVNKVIEYISIAHSLDRSANKDNFLSEFKQTSENNFICRSCLYSFTKFHDLLQKRYGFGLLREFFARICGLNQEYTVCKAALDLYEPMVTTALIDHYFNPEYICSSRFICSNIHFEYLNPDDYARELLKDKPVNVKEEPKMDGNKLKILHVTDIHTDFYYTEVIINFYFLIGN